MLISAIIPAYNEEKTIGSILTVLKEVHDIDEIIVVSDGSVDRTAFISRELGARVIGLPQNMGKGAAVKKGLEECSGDIVLFLDADLVGLTKKHVECLLKPVKSGQADMTLGIFGSGRFSTSLAQKISPCLSGQRAIRKHVLDKMDYLGEIGYGLEIALTRYAVKEKLMVSEVELEHLTHVMKEEKLGFIRGFYERIKMYWQIYKGARLARR